MDDKEKGSCWNKIMTVISIINIFLISYYSLNNYSAFSSFKKYLTVLVAVYTVVCSIRAIYPRIENTKLCFYSNSTPILGRILATIGELSFAEFFTQVTGKIIKFSNVIYLNQLNNVLFPLIVFAQICCWVGIITTDPLWNVVEESIWTFFGIIKIIIYMTIYYFVKDKNVRDVCIPIIIGIIVYVTFMLTTDVPMYVKKSKEHNGKYLGLRQGITELLKCKKVTKSYNEWKVEVPWLTAYFSFAVWFSQSLLFWFNNQKI